MSEMTVVGETAPEPVVPSAPAGLADETPEETARVEDLSARISLTPAEQAELDALSAKRHERTLVKHPHGTVLPTGEKMVEDRDEAGNLVGWHKEPA